MIPQPPTNTSSADRVCLPFTFDVQKMMHEIDAMRLKPYHYYDVKPLRSPAHMVDTSLPIPPPAEDYADGSWTPWMNVPELEQSSYLKSIVDFFSTHTDVTLVRILRLAPGQVVQEHTDPTLGLEEHKSVIRLTIPVINEAGVSFYLNSEAVPMKPGECWYLRLTDPHSVVNNSARDRVNISIDMIPNEWVRSVIAQAQAQETES